MSAHNSGPGRVGAMKWSRERERERERLAAGLHKLASQRCSSFGEVASSNSKIRNYSTDFEEIWYRGFNLKADMLFYFGS